MFFPQALLQVPQAVAESGCVMAAGQAGTEGSSWNDILDWSRDASEVHLSHCHILLSNQEKAQRIVCKEHAQRSLTVPEPRPLHTTDVPPRSLVPLQKHCPPLHSSPAPHALPHCTRAGTRPGGGRRRMPASGRGLAGQPEGSAPDMPRRDRWLVHGSRPTWPQFPMSVSRLASQPVPQAVEAHQGRTSAGLAGRHGLQNVRALKLLAHCV